MKPDLKLKIKALTGSFLLVSNLLLPVSQVWGEVVTPITPTAPTAPTIVTVQPTAPTTPTSPDLSALSGGQTTDPVVSVTSDPTNTPTNNDSDWQRRRSSSTNTGNGAGSTNTSSNTANDTTDVNQANNADVTNVVDVSGDTGNNQANKNMGDGSITSGDSSTGAAIINDINNNHVTIGDLCGLGCSDGFVEANLANGSGTLNNADGSLTRAVLMNNANNLTLENLANLRSNTGNNTASKNMGNGVLVSGDADVVFNLINLGNNNFINPNVVTFNVLDSQSEDITINFPADAFGAGIGAGNVGNGSGSTNNANTTSNTTTIINSQNDLNLDNNVSLSADTGHNTADKNMGSGDITTGDANIVSNIINFLNNNIVAGAQFLISTVNIFGDMSGNIILPREADLTACGCAADLTAANSGNGANSTNTATASSTNALDVNQTNNAIVTNNLNLDANTGGNTTDQNMGNSSITTGNTNVDSNLVTVANTNTVGQGDTWWLVLVNNQGQWTGKIVGADNGATIAGSGMEFGVGPDGQVYALNSGNGADSTNTASTTTNDSTTINQTNNATIDNNVNISANTGDNTANKNMGGASIKTGDVNVASNIVNFINNNFVGKKFVITIVNIFGKFTGSIIPPDQKIPEKAGIGGPTNIDIGGQTITATTAKNKKSSVAQANTKATTGSLSQLLTESGKLLDNAASTQNKVNDSVSKVVKASAQKSSFQFNFVLLGLALLVLAAYVFVARRKAS